MRVELAVFCILAAMFVTWGVTVLWMRHRQLKKIGEYQDEVLKKQREEVQNIYETMRGWRHDEGLYVDGSGRRDGRLSGSS